ncbi:hypothetical protein ACGFX4_37685 [Kitasatospora sp. NPDC048365]|uniref:hypothetical protein n=1 Tax=Kitasatospora sp. NPDC048365 TaxID=3364050 RepID=UPI0037118FF4
MSAERAVGSAVGRERFEELRWQWERPVPLRYLLVGEERDGGQLLLARCSDVDGLFVEGPAPEELVLEACSPTGRLLKAIRRAEREPVRLGTLNLTAEFPCDHPNSYDGWAIQYWDLHEVVVHGSEPNGSDPDLLDVRITGLVAGPFGGSLTPDPDGEPEGLELSIDDDGTGRTGVCRRIPGLYLERPRRAGPPLRLVGCEPAEQLALQLARPRAGSDPAGPMTVELWPVDRDGTVVRTRDRLDLEIVEARPSVLGGGLLDVQLREGPASPPRPAVEPVWRAWRRGAGRERNGWAAFDTEGREEWLQFVRVVEPAAAGGVGHLDGRYVTDLPGLRCAVGEALAGPGQQVSLCWNLPHGCSCTSLLFPEPFTLVWHDADVARRALAEGRLDAVPEGDYFTSAVRMLERAGMTVELR